MAAATSTALRGRFTYPRSSEVVYGPGTLEQLPQLIDGLGASRAFVVASRTLVMDGLRDQLGALLGDRLAGVHAGVAQHVPRTSVLAAAAVARKADADLLISVGGGTPIDCAKAVALCLAEDITRPEEFDAFHIRFTYPDQLDVPRMPDAVPPHLSAPTTLSGSEHTNLFGITDHERQVKHLYTGAAFAPRAVILDAQLGLATPPDLWAASGVRALDHAVEGTLSQRHVPFMDGLALESLRTLRARLTSSVAGSDRLEARSDCLLAAWLAAYALTNVGTGLSHAIGHQLAAQFDIMHGVTSAIMLPHVMRFNAPIIAARMARFAEPLGVEVREFDDHKASLRVIEALADMIAELEPFGVPHSLRAAGATKPELEQVADRVLGDMGAAVNPRPVDHDALMALFDAAW